MALIRNRTRCDFPYGQQKEENSQQSWRPTVSKHRQCSNIVVLIRWLRANMRILGQGGAAAKYWTVKIICQESVCDWFPHPFCVSASYHIFDYGNNSRIHICIG